MIKINEEDEGNEEYEEENSFLSGFGVMHSDTDESTEIDSNIKGQAIVAKESAKKQQEDCDNKQESTENTGRSII